MRVVNNLTRPGGIRRVDLNCDTVHIRLQDGTDRVYRLSTMMKIECAWCEKSLGEKEGNGQSGVSHGICPECAAKVTKEGCQGATAPVTEAS